MLSKKILVLHVRAGHEDRKQHIDKMLSRRGLTFEYVLDGDISDLTPGTLDRYFTGDMHQASAVTSCAMKHILACQYIIGHHLDGALVLEDDMILYPNFEQVFEDCMNELKSRKLSRAIISFEDSSLKFVPRSERVPGLHLYRKQRDRFTGALYYTREAAQLILGYVLIEHCDLPIDLFHTALIKRKGLGYYWCHPCIATQGTHTGLFSSSISLQSAQRQRYRQLTWQVKLIYKKILYWFR